MGKIIVSEFITLDGVMQAPGDEQEMERGGWNFPFMDDQAIDYKVKESLAAEALLLGGITYQGFAAAWPDAEADELSNKYNSMRKYVVSPEFTEADLTWNNTVQIKDNIVEEIRRLKEQAGDLLVHGSSQLVQTLLQHDLVDELRLQLHPIIVGMGKQLFREGLDQKAWKLESHEATPSGMLLLSYVPKEQ